MKIKLQVFTPSGKIFEKDADIVNFRTVEGAMGVLPRRAPIITHLAISKVEVVSDGKREKIGVAGGFLYCDGEKVTVLTTDARV
jgi:F-type H+-transporting ATPase subunit epsilon